MDEPDEDRIDIGVISVVRSGPLVSLEGSVPWLGPAVYAVHVGDGIRYVPLSGRQRQSNRTTSNEQQQGHVAFARALNRNRPEEGCASMSLRWVRNLGCLFLLFEVPVVLVCGFGVTGLVLAAASISLFVMLALLQYAVFLVTTRAFLAFYDLEPEVAQLWARLQTAFSAMPAPVMAGQAKVTWDIKRNAGCDHEYRLVEATPRVVEPPIHTNTLAAVWNSHLGVMVLLPDGVHRFEREGTKVYPWSLVDVSLERHEVPHVAPPDPPPPRARDGWLYSNKDGTPDLRYADNLEVGVYRYMGLRLVDQTGELDEVLLCPDVEAMRGLRAALVDYARAAAAPGTVQ